jgi:hypothetical protein
MNYDMEMLKKALFLNIQKYAYNRAQYLKRCGLEVDDGARRQIWDEYGLAVKEVIRHLQKEFPNGFLHQEGALELSFEGLSEETRVFLEMPSIDCTFQPFDDCSALMSFEKGILRDAYDLETLPNLPNKYRTPLFNGVLEGRSIFEIRDLFRSLGILPNNNMLDIAIEEYAMRKTEKTEFAKAVITSLLLSSNEEDITRAYIFNYFMDTNFDFEVYKSVEEKRTK